MFAQPQIRRWTQLTSAVLVGCLIYQLGACPCGCLEHNYWLGLVGFADHEPIATTSSSSTVGESHEDDCHDGHRGPYFNTSPRVEIAGVAGGSVVMSYSHVTRSTLYAESDFGLDRGPPIFGTAPRCDSLQVFRL